MKHDSHTLWGLKLGPLWIVFEEQSAQNILQQCLHRCFLFVTLKTLLHAAHSLKSSSCWHLTSIVDGRPDPSTPLLELWYGSLATFIWLSSICSDCISLTRSSCTDILFLASFFNDCIWLTSSWLSSFLLRNSCSFCSVRCLSNSIWVWLFSFIDFNWASNSCLSVSVSIRTFLSRSNSLSKLWVIASWSWVLFERWYWLFTFQEKKIIFIHSNN